MESDVNQKVKDIEKYNKQKLGILTGEERKKFKELEYKSFDEIYQIYGERNYNQYVPKKYRKKDIKALLKEQRFGEIYNKHGREIFEKYSYRIVASDVTYETGSKLRGLLYGAMYKIKHALKHDVAPIALSALLLPSGFALLSSYERMDEIEKNQTEITEYLNDIDIYGSKIAKYKLSDIQNIMLVMDDMWANIQGYGSNEDLLSYPGLSLKEKINEETGEKELGYGVCRNFADYFAAVFNSIDQAYDARVVIVNMNDGKGYVPADVEYNIIENNESSSEKQNGFEEWFLTNGFGNHAIVVMYSKENPNFQLVVDPTNMGIGVLNNGKIEMFNSKEDDPLVHSQTYLGAPFLGVSSMEKNIIGNLQSVLSLSNEELKELKEKYGVEAQNRALKEIQKYKKESFAEGLRIHTENSSDKNVSQIVNKVEEKHEDVER